MSMPENAILVIGTTGHQGGAVACHLLGRGFHVRALVRDPSKSAAQNLAAQGVEVVQEDSSAGGAQSQEAAGG